MKWKTTQILSYKRKTLGSGDNVYPLTLSPPLPPSTVTRIGLKTTLNYVIVIVCSTKWSAKYLEAWSFLVSKTKKSLCYQKVRVLFSNHSPQLVICYHKRPEKPRNLKRYILWKIFTKKFKKSKALKLPKPDWMAVLVKYL